MYNGIMVLAIDYGTRKIGLAISDETELVSSILPTLFVKSDEETLQGIIKQINIHKVDKVVLGMPSSWGNIEGTQTKLVKAFKITLEKAINMPVIEWDETYSSKIAEKNIKKKQKLNSDSYAAALILQEYLDYIRYEKNII
jgi:putative Holliday junction resolvase